MCFLDSGGTLGVGPSFLYKMQPHFFVAGLRQSLTEEGIGQAFFLSTGLPPFLRLRELRSVNRGDLKLCCIKMGQPLSVTNQFQSTVK